MSESAAFTPGGKTIKVAGTDAAPAGIQAVKDGKSKIPVQFRIHNAGPNTAFYAFGEDATTAQSNAVIPTGAGANAKPSYPLPSGAIEVISAPVDSYWSAICAATETAAIYITPGRGL